MILNLAGNAIYYNRPDGRIERDRRPRKKAGGAARRRSGRGDRAGRPAADLPAVLPGRARSRSARRGGPSWGSRSPSGIVETHRGEISFDNRPAKERPSSSAMPLAPTPVDAADSRAIAAISASAADA